jgi:hypothetical protein
MECGRQEKVNGSMEKALLGVNGDSRPQGPLLPGCNLGMLQKNNGCGIFQPCEVVGSRGTKKVFLRFSLGKTVDLWSLRREQWLDGTPVAPLGFYHRQFTD